MFKKLSGKPCWGVKHIYGGIISFEFGKPRLEFHEPQRISRNVSHRVRDLFASRWVHIKGEWTLLIWFCDWEIFRRGNRLGTNRMRSNIERVAHYLEGQKLVSFSIKPQNLRSIFKFDLGGKLVTMTTPFDKELELWMVYEPTGKILTPAWRWPVFLFHVNLHTAEYQGLETCLSGWEVNRARTVGFFPILIFPSSFSNRCLP